MTTTTDAPAREVTTRVPAHTLTWPQIRAALPGALRKLHPAAQWRNPVMMLVWVGAVFLTVLAVVEPFLGAPSAGGPAFTAVIAAWLWLTVLFANLAESIAEGRGKAQADTLRRTRSDTTAHRVEQ